MRDGWLDATAHDYEGTRTPTFSPVTPMLRRSLAVFFAIPLLALPARGQGVATLCKDGTTTTTTGRGACTGHGGVDKKAAKQSARVAKAETKVETKTAKAETKAAKAETRAEKKSEKAAQRAAAAPASMPAAAAPVAKPTPAPVRRTTTAPAASTMPAPPAATRAAATPRAAAPSAAHVSNTDPTGATALCKDGTYSHSASHRGACARHQGVAKWL